MAPLLEVVGGVKLVSLSGPGSLNPTYLNTLPLDRIQRTSTSDEPLVVERIDPIFQGLQVCAAVLSETTALHPVHREICGCHEEFIRCSPEGCIYRRRIAYVSEPCSSTFHEMTTGGFTMLTTTTRQALALSATLVISVAPAFP
jgi:hypothetical protein